MEKNVRSLILTTCFALMMATYTGCSSDNNFGNGFNNGGSFLTLLDSNGEPIANATLYVAGSGATSQTVYAPTYFSANRHQLGLTDTDGDTCDDPPETFIFGDCSNSLGQVPCPTLPDGTEATLFKDGTEIGTFDLTCGSGGQEEQFDNFTNGNVATDEIQVVVNSVPDMDSCEDDLYAVTYTDFDNNHEGENQVALTDQGSGTWSGTLDVTDGATNVMVYIYCDASQGGHTYDDEPGSKRSDINFTNTASFNACDRNTTGPQTSTATTSAVYDFTDTHTYYSSYIYSNWSYSYPSYFYDAFAITPNNSSAGAGDAFAIRLGDGSDTITLGFTDLVTLSGSDHPDSWGTLQQSCNCIAGVEHHATYSYYNYTYTYTDTYYYYYSSASFGTRSSTFYYKYYSLYNYFYSAGFFTDTNRTSDSDSGSCVMP